MNSKKLIMAVDDKPELLTGVVVILREMYSAVALTSGPAALKALDKLEPQLFLLDIEMPGMDGYELAERIRAIPKHKDTPIIFLTATDAALDSDKCPGNYDYIIKPADKDLLMSRVKERLDGVNNAVIGNNSFRGVE